MSSQSHWSTETQSQRDTESQRHRERRHRDTESQRHRDTETQRHRDKESQRHRVRVTETQSQSAADPQEGSAFTLSVSSIIRSSRMQKEAGAQPISARRDTLSCTLCSMFCVLFSVFYALFYSDQSQKGSSSELSDICKTHRPRENPGSGLIAVFLGLTLVRAV